MLLNLSLFAYYHLIKQDILIPYYKANKINHLNQNQMENLRVNLFLINKILLN